LIVNQGSDAAVSDERVSVVVPCRNEAVRIAALLDAIRSQETPVLEIVVVDTGSTDGTVDIVGCYQRRHSDPPLRCLSHPGAGIAEAVNSGIEAAQGEIIVRLDGHSRPTADYVGRALVALRETGAAVVGGVWDIAPGGLTRVAEGIALAVAHPIGAGNAAYRTTRTITTGGGRTEVDTVPFGCFRKTTWEALGGFDERLLTNEDYEFNYRARASGSSVVLDADIRCTYFARGALTELASQYFRYGWWKAQMLKRHPRSLRWRQALPGALVPGFLCLAVAGLVWPVSMLLLGGLALAYGAVLSVSAVQVAGGRQHRWGLVWPLVAAFATVHVSWSTGFATNIVSLGRWPLCPSQSQGAATGGQRGFSGVRLLLALAAILVLAVIAPPGLATLVNLSRIDRAQEEVRRLADALQDAGFVDRAGAQATDDLLGGPGNAPEASGARQWVDGRVGSLSGYVSEPLRSDPWGNRYLVNVGAMQPNEKGADVASTEPSALWVHAMCCSAWFSDVLLNHTGVASVPGSAFHLTEAGHNLVRFCFAKTDADLKDACTRLRRL
jgi:succinoglycan biosynthesis protein ExoA